MIAQNSENLPAVIADRDKKELEALISGICVAKPALKDRLTVASAWYFLNLPDQAYGWVDNRAMSRFEKLLMISAHLQLDLMPGMGLINYLGNKMYITVAAARDKAKPFIASRRPRACTDEEKQMLGADAGDVTLAVDMTFKFPDQEVETTGYGIVEKSQLNWRSDKGHTLPGLKNKKDIFQTLQTRAESDIFKHHIPMHGFSVEPDAIDRNDIIDVSPQRDRLPSSEARPIIEASEQATSESNETIHKERLEALTNALIDVVNEKAAQGALSEITQLVGMSSNDLLQQPLDKIEAAIEAIRDMKPKKDQNQPTNVNDKRGRPAGTKNKTKDPNGPLAPPKKPIEHTCDPTTVPDDALPSYNDGKNRPRNKAYLMIEKIIKSDKVSAEIKNGLRVLWKRMLYLGDEDIIKQSVEMAMDGDMQQYQEFIDSRKELPDLPPENGLENRE